MLLVRALEEDEQLGEVVVVPLAMATSQRQHCDLSVALTQCTGRPAIRIYTDEEGACEVLALRWGTAVMHVPASSGGTTLFPNTAPSPFPFTACLQTAYALGRIVRQHVRWTPTEAAPAIKRQRVV